MNKRDFKAEVNMKDSAWSLVQQWIRSAQNYVEVLEGNHQLGEIIIHKLGITPRSSIEAVALETGGIFCDHGWLRLLGSGNEQMRGNLLSWNGIGNEAVSNIQEGAYIIAYDIIGGFFALNEGNFSDNRGEIFYLAPDTLQWENLQMSYSQFLYWSFFGNLEGFYQTYRWPNWQKDLLTINGDQGISIYPFLWADADTPIDARSRHIVPIIELWNIQQNISIQIRDLPEGAKIRLHISEE